MERDVSNPNRVLTPEALRELEAVRELTEVHNLNRLRLPDGTHDPSVLMDTVENLTTAVKEMAIPHAVSTVHQEYRDGSFYWLDLTEEEVAESGYVFHWHPAAHARVDVEKAEVVDARENLKPGMAKVMISPRMSTKDAPYEIAKQEHLADEDMIRLHGLDMQGNELKGKYMQSGSMKHIPLEAWVAMLQDPNNIFGKSIAVEDPESALSVMQTHAELYLSLDDLPEGVITIIEAVKPYADPDAQRHIDEQLAWLRLDQAELHQKASNIAERWLTFEVELADSLHQKYATPAIEDFIASLSEEWSTEFNDMLRQHIRLDGSIAMTEELAVLLEQSRKNTHVVAAAVITDNRHVISQLSTKDAQSIYEQEMHIQIMQQNGLLNSQQIQQLEEQNGQRIAQANIEAGGGCPGSNSGAFGGADKKGPEESKESCVIKTTCPNCSHLNTDGSERKEKVEVTAVIDASKTIHCRRCSAWANDKHSFEGFIKMRVKKQPVGVK